MALYFLPIWVYLFIFFFFFSFIFISWRLITLQYRSGPCHTLTWISHGFTCEWVLFLHFLHNQNGQLHPLRWPCFSSKQLFLEGVESKRVLEYHTDILHLINSEIIIGFLCQLPGEFIFIKGLVQNWVGFYISVSKF